MKNVILFILAFSVAAVCLSPSVSAGDRTVRYLNAKTVGVGGARVAGGHSYNGFVDNPALLSRVEGVRFSIINLPITLNKHTTDITDFITANYENFQNFDDLPPEDMVKFLDDVQDLGGKWARMNVAPMVDIAFSIFGQSLGLAFYNSSDFTLKVDRGIYEPRVWGAGTTNFATVLGYSRPLTMLYPGLTLGVNLKYLERRKASLFQIKATDLGDIAETIGPVQDEISEHKHNTFAADIGVLWDIPFIDMEVGGVFHSLGDGRGASLDLGMSKFFLNDNLLVLADYVDFLDNNNENIFNKLHFGAEYSLQTLKFRVGVNRGYPALGFGFNFRVVDIDAAYYLEELGNAPGIDDDDRFVVQLRLGWI